MKKDEVQIIINEAFGNDNKLKTVGDLINFIIDRRNHR
jgi:hypothetical protein